MTYELLADKAKRVEALYFTGTNRDETKAFVDRLIVIRNGRFFIGTGYVVANQWVVKHPDQTLEGLTEEEFKGRYQLKP